MALTICLFFQLVFYLLVTVICLVSSCFVLYGKHPFQKNNENVSASLSIRHVKQIIETVTSIINKLFHNCSYHFINFFFQEVTNDTSVAFLCKTLINIGPSNYINERKITLKSMINTYKFNQLEICFENINY